jgi:glycosyltransferase involved in cell wall biosynthesis
MILSVLICSLHNRDHFLKRLLGELHKQMNQYNLNNNVQILISIDNGEKSIGIKRNELINQAKGEYVCFIDDDDMVSPFYLKTIVKGCELNYDCVGLVGQMTIDGNRAKTFIHSARFKTYFEQNRIYYRPPNHLNAIKKTIAEQFKFPEKNFGEDTDWAMQVSKSNLIQTEAPVNVVLYYYLFRSKK